MGAKKITKFLGPNEKELNIFFGELGVRLEKEEKMSCLLIYYSGHGTQDIRTCIVLNQKGKFYPLEMRIRNIASVKNTFVFAIFDCCRQKLVIKGETESEPGNFVFIYGCNPGYIVVRDSKLLIKIEQQLKEKTETINNTFLLPEAVMYLKKLDPKIELVTGCLSPVKL